MIFSSQKMTLKVMRIVLTGEVNDVYICQDQKVEAKTLYTVWRIKKHNITHGFLRMFDDSDKKIEDCCDDYFTHDDDFIVVLPYVKERPLESFFVGMSNSLQESENVCVSLVVNMMTSKMPYPLMYLALEQGQLNISKDNDVYLGNMLDLTELDYSIGERNCVVSCAKVVSKLLATNKNAMSYELIQKKISRTSYSYFTELFKDIRMAAAPEKKRNIFTKLKAWFNRNKDNIFKWLLVISIILAVIVLISFVSNLFFGEVSWLKIFFGKIKYIGTECLIE